MLRKQTPDEIRLAELRQALATLIENDLLTPLGINLGNGNGARKIRLEIRQIEKRLHGQEKENLG